MARWPRGLGSKRTAGSVRPGGKESQPTDRNGWICSTPHVDLRPFSFLKGSSLEASGGWVLQEICFGVPCDACRSDQTPLILGGWVEQIDMLILATSAIFFDL